MPLRKATYVRPEGNPESAEWALFGEQPGKSEIMKGRPFVGPSGKVLNETLSEAGLNRQRGYISNIFKDLDRPLEKYIRIQTKGKTTVHISEEGQEYMAILKEELSKLNCTTLIACGNVSLFALTGRVGIQKWRGSILECNLDPKFNVIPIIHPATTLPPKGQFLNRHLIRFDLIKAGRVMNNDYRSSNRNILIGPSFDECMNYLEHVKEICYNDHPMLAYDIEIYNMQMSCISFALDDNNAISIPFLGNNGDYFSIEEELAIMEKIAEILEEPRIAKTGQNLSFDAHFLLSRYGIKARNLNDTMIAQQILLPDYPKGLDFITSVWTDHPYYKDEGKHWFKVGGAMEQLWHYNATDSIICAEAFPKQMDQLIKTRNVHTYERQRSIIEPLVYMQEHGIKADVEGIKNEYKRMMDEADELKEKLNSVAGKPLNPNSSKQLIEYFYVEKKYRPYKNRTTGNMTVDAMALKRLARKGSEEAKLILKIRNLVKLAGTYLNLDKFDSDNRIRCSYNPVGTRYSRLSSSQNIFGTGGNMQNWPHSLRQYLIPDDGYLFYSFDLSQAENRIVAYVGNIHEMIEAFETGKDVHSLTASLISGIPYDEIKQQDKEDVPAPLGDGTKTWRFWGKKANHGLNYDLGYGSFALYYEIPERDAKFIIEQYHKAYPGVRQSFHSYIRSCLRKNRIVENLMGRRTLFLDEWGDSLFKEAYSCIPQGTTGDVINERGLIEIYYNPHQYGPVELMMQVHDDIGFQIPVETPWYQTARMLDGIKRSLETPLKTHHGTEFVIPADLVIGKNLNKQSCTELKHTQWPSDIDELAQKLEKIHEEL